MKIYCSKCDQEVDVIAVPSGPHIKAICPDGHYLKFLNPEEKKRLEKEEDAVHTELHRYDSYRFCDVDEM